MKKSSTSSKMFLSAQYVGHIDFDEKIDRFRDLYRIVDTDFVEVAMGVGITNTLLLGAPYAAIEIYRDRDLPVVPNLIRCWQYQCKKYDTTMNRIVELSKLYNLYFAEYEDEINKYLLLL